MDQYEGQIVDPTWELGSVNVDSLKEVLLNLSTAFPFLDESTRSAFSDQILALGTSGDPHKSVAEVAVDEKDAEIAKLQAQIAELQNNPAHGQGQ